MKRSLILLFLFSQLQYIINAQVNSDMVKYWHYRNRLNNFFVILGEQHGESQVIGVRNNIGSDNDPSDIWGKGKSVDYGQHGKYTGYYIGTLATEYYLLYKNEQYEDASKTYQELLLALKAIKVYWDEKAEPFWGVNESFNGFFIRGNVPCDFYAKDNINGNNHGYTQSGERHIDLLNKNLDSTCLYDPYEFRFRNKNGGYFPRGHPGYIDHRTHSQCYGTNTSNLTPLHSDHSCQENFLHPHVHDFHPESMSQDEAIWLLMGFELTIKLAGGICADFALTMKEKIIRYLINCDSLYGILKYRLYEPDGQYICNNEGGSTYAYAVPLMLEIGAIPDVISSLVWQFLSSAPAGNFPDLTAVIGAISNSWIHTGACINVITQKNNWETFYILLWEVLHNIELPFIHQQNLCNKAIDQLNAAPCNGPFCYKQETQIDDQWQNGILSGNGWASSYKWCHFKDEQNHGGWCTGNYNGLDYMLFYNLYHIINYQYCPNYVNYNDRKLVGIIPVSSHTDETGMGAPIYYDYYGTNDSPLRFIAFNTIISTQKINAYNHVIDYILHPGTNNEEIVYTSVAANVTYKAGEAIHLKPGFRVEEGSYFHAYIGDIDCSEYGNSKPSDENDYPDNMYTPYFDSLISAPKTPYDLEVEDTTGDNNLVTLECPVDTLKFKGIYGDTIDELHTYYWDFGNGITSTEVDPEVFYQPGTYDFTLILTDTNGVADTMKMVLVVPDCGAQTGTQEQTTSSSLSNGAVSIVPNPNNGEMWLLSKNTYIDGCRLVIYDITGREVYTKQITVLTGKTLITTSGLLNGVYLYAVISEQGNLIAKDKLVIINK